jgi:hypothetical protein
MGNITANIGKSFYTLPKDVLSSLVLFQAGSKRVKINVPYQVTQLDLRFSQW